MVPISGSIVRTRALVNSTGRPASFATISSKALLFQFTVPVWVTLIACSSAEWIHRPAERVERARAGRGGVGSS